MEQLRAELSHLLGEKLSRMECVSERPDTTLWSCMTARKSDAATGEEFSTWPCTSTGMENLNAGTQWYGTYACRVWRNDP
jgi:hypothetical protein